MYYPNCYKIDMILIIDIIHHKTATHSLIAVNHHQPKPRMPPFLAKPSHIWPLHLEALPGMELRRQRPPPQPLDRPPMSLKAQMYLEQYS
jgi:hypothetical protein